MAKLSAGAIAGIVIACLVVVVIVVTLPFVIKKHPTPPTPECDPTHSCPSGQYCNSQNQCVPIPSTCGDNNPCPPGQTCNASGQCVSNPSQQCSAQNPTCPTGYTCDIVSGTCQPNSSIQCSNNNDCSGNANGSLCCRQQDGSSSCKQCCSTNDCDLNKNQICVNGQCVTPVGPTSCSTNADCTNPTAPNCCNGTCQGCCSNANCPVGQLCTNGVCTTPSTGTGLVLPAMQIQNWLFLPSQEFGGSLIVYGLSQYADRISFTFQGDGNLATRCAGPGADPSSINNVIGEFSFGGGFGQNSDGTSRQSILQCSASNMTCSPDCTEGETCLFGVCTPIPAGTANFSWIVIGHWLITALYNDLYFVNVNTNSPQNGSYIKLQADGNIISVCANAGTVATLISGPKFSACTDQSTSLCPPNCGLNDTTQTITQYCLVDPDTKTATCQQLSPNGGVIVPFVQLSGWTLYEKPVGISLKKNIKTNATNSRTQLWFENSGQQRVSYTIAGDGNIISYCRGGDGVSKTTSGSLGSGTNGSPGMVSFCTTNPPLPVSNTCVSNSDCTTAGQICIGRTCQTIPV